MIARLFKVVVQKEEVFNPASTTGDIEEDCMVKDCAQRGMSNLVVIEDIESKQRFQTYLCEIHFRGNYDAFELEPYASPQRID